MSWNSFFWGARDRGQKTFLIKSAALVLWFFGTPVFVQSAPPQLTTLSISAGETYGLALRSDGTVWAWGTNVAGELGLGGTALSLFPVHVSRLSNIVGIAAGPSHSLAVQSSGSVWAWGTNGDGELGNGTLVNTNLPVQVLAMTNATAVAAGLYHSLALRADGTVMGWGTNAWGQLGNVSNTSTSTNQPVMADGLTNVVAIAAGWVHSMALTASGEVWTWGDNSYGELGLGDNMARFWPVKIPNFTNITQISAGDFHCLALRQDGHVYAWGTNIWGELGNGTTNSANSPMLVTNLDQVKSISAGFCSSSAVRTNGSLFQWGWHFFNNVVTSPQLAGDGDIFKSASYGYGFFLALKEDGSVWGWGDNRLGQWGNGSLYSSYSDLEVDKPSFSFSPFPWAQQSRVNRGDRNFLNYNSFVLPLDLERGIKLEPSGSDVYEYGQGTPWFLRTQKEQVQHCSQLITGTTNVSRFLVENPVAAFGSQGGGSPLYVGQGYTLGFYAGAFDEGSGVTNVIRISAYDRSSFSGNATNVTPTNVFYISLPRRFAADSNAWMNFATNGFVQLLETNGLRTTVEFVDGRSNAKPWGLSWITNGSGTPLVASNLVLAGYKIIHSATSTNYFYKVDAMGVAQVAANTSVRMGTNSSGAWVPLPLYTLDFETLPPLRSVLIDQPYFEGIQQPSIYAGKTLAQLNGLTAMATNAVWLTNYPGFTNLDGSPELRSHPILDQFVQEMGRDPLALASYVINEIDLTDPFASAEKSKVVADSINLGGINRSALGVFLEGQGSPAEQCALLVYLLRKAGYYAAYVFPTNNNLRLLDTRVSQLWRIQVKGVTYPNGIPYITNSLIVANYPWVVANIGTNCVHIFPWLKDTEIVEQRNLYDFMPTNYDTGYKWAKNYALAKPEIMSLAPDPNVPLVLWPKFIQQTLSANPQTVALSLDDFGVRAFNRRNQFPTWANLPQPDFLTNQTQVAVVTNLSNSAVTFPFLTNIFDRARVQIYRGDFSGGNLILDSGDWDACDWHNRKFLLFTNGNHVLNMWLAPYRTNITNVSAFTGPSSTNKQLLQFTLNATDTVFKVRMTHQRRTSTLATPYNYFQLFSDPKTTTNDATCSRCDVVSLCFSYGRVRPAMVQVFAEDYWRLQRQRATNTALVPAIEDYQGTAATLLGMGYFEKLDRFDVLNQRVHKLREFTRFYTGLAKLAAASSSTQMQAQVDMIMQEELIIGNGSLRPDAGDRFYNAVEDYLAIDSVAYSAQEHDIINSTFPDKDAISTVRLLQLAAQRATNSGWAAPVELNSRNYQQLGGQTNFGYGTNLLRNQDPLVWQLVTNYFGGWDSDYVRVIITPGLITNDTGSYKGLGAWVLAQGGSAALISANQSPINGGWGSLQPTLDFSGVRTDPTLPYNLLGRDDGSVWFQNNDSATPKPESFLTPQDVLTMGIVAWDPAQQAAADQQNAANGASPNTSVADSNRSTADGGGNGPLAVLWNLYDKAAEPVNVVNGEFYMDTTDLRLPGPFPLALRRNYLSHNYAGNMFGYGWKMNFMPSLVLATNAASQEIIYAAELDGSVIAFRKATNDLWLVYATDNPSLNNQTVSGIGSTANYFNARLERYTTNGTTYIVKTPDGSKRFYNQMTFAISGGTNTINRTRPYLVRAEDNRGNYHLFYYGTNGLANDYGQLNRIESANGNFMDFHFDVAARITDAFTGDGRRLNYQYDDYGDLVGVTLPDFSTWSYQYEHSTFKTTNNSVVRTNIYSTHRLVQEIKPNGRVLQNAYDAQGRVLNQAATVGADLRLVTNAVFLYNNNFTNWSNTVISGTTAVLDYLGRTNTVFQYGNNQITNVVNALSFANLQVWFDPTTETNVAGYYQRSLKYSVDQRGLTNQFRYDLRGNVTNVTVQGDLTGDGNFGQSAVTTITYTTNDQPDTVTDPAGNAVRLLYESPAYIFLPTRSIRSAAGGVAIATNYNNFTNVTDIVDMGGWNKTNRAFGVRIQEVRADVATNEWNFDGRGFVTSEIRCPVTADYPDNTDPVVTHSFSYTARGDLYEQQDSAGRRTRFDHDAMGRRKWREVLDENGISLFGEYFYYNRNGELEWYDGPASGPQDYVHFDYDGAGRKRQEIRMRCRAKQDGSGVEAETGDDLYATTFYEYDPLSSLTRVTDPRGVAASNRVDALGQVTNSLVIDADGTLLSTESYAYEAGGLVTNYTNPLGGVIQRQYTSTGKIKFQQKADGSTNGWRYYLDGRLATNFLRNGAYWKTTYDDANRKIINTFYSAGNSPLSTNTVILDRRGNVFRTIDAAGNNFTNIYDGLDRVKIMAGPVVTNYFPPGIRPMTLPDGSPLASFELAVTNYYDASGKTFVALNALGEATITTSDALARPTAVGVVSADGTLVRTNSTIFSPDHHSFTTWAGSGPTAIPTTVFTDNNGNNVLTLRYPGAGQAFGPPRVEFTLQAYDSVGNRTQLRESSVSNGVLTTWATNLWGFDGLNRIHTETVGDGATTINSWDALGDLIQKVMPGGLTWTGVYTNDGRLLLDYDSSSGAAARTNSRAYYAAGESFPGLLKTLIDGRNVTNNFGYDDWLHMVSQTSTGILPEERITTSLYFDARELVTLMTENFTDSSTGPSNAVSRKFDANRALQEEKIFQDGEQVSFAAQTHESSGRRSSVGFAEFTYGFTWQPDNLLASVLCTRAGGGASYTYDLAGQINTRTAGLRSTSVTQRDGTGRPLAIVTSLFGTTKLTETLTWRPDNRLAMHIVGRAGDFTNQQAYGYTPWSRRLNSEQINLDATHTWTNSYGYDNAQPSSLGVLTKESGGISGSGAAAITWSGGVDSLSRINAGTNPVTHAIAVGRVNGPCTITALLDGVPMPVTSLVNSNGGQYRASLELTPGAHQLNASAIHPSMLFTNFASSWFTNSESLETVSDGMDLAGNVTNRVWMQGTNVVRTQTLSWDGRGRLWKVIERDAQTNGINWSAVYDPLGRRLSTTTITVTNGITNSAFPTTIVQRYDPDFQFLELGVFVNGVATWKLYGPDASGRYGEMQGVGGLEAIAPPPDLFCPIASDFRGNLHGVYDPRHLGFLWFSSRLTGYGAVPGYRPPPLGFGSGIAAASAWRNCWSDPTGYYCRGRRYYDSVAGRWLSADPVGHGTIDQSLYTFAGGDPINSFDSDGRLTQKIRAGAENGASYLAGTIQGVAEVFIPGYDPGVPNTDAQYNGRLGGRDIGVVAAGLIQAKGDADIGIGGGTMVLSVAAEGATGGAATIFAAPGFAAGAAQAGLGTAEAALGAIGLINFNNLDPVPKPEGSEPGSSAGENSSAGGSPAAEGGSLPTAKYDPVGAFKQGADPATVVPDSYVIVRGGQSATPSPGTGFSGSMGETVSDAAAGVPHGTISITTAGEIRAAGGSVTLAPELTRGGTINWSHVNVIEGGEATGFGPQVPNPVPRAGRIR